MLLTDFPEENQLPEVFRDFKVFLNGVRLAVELKIVTTPSRGPKVLGKQAGCRRMQDSLDLNGKSESSFENESCAACGHPSVIIVGKSQAEGVLTSHNVELKSDYKSRIDSTRKSHSFFRRGTKPTPGKAISVNLACLCTQMHCLQ